MEGDFSLLRISFLGKRGNMPTMHLGIYDTSEGLTLCLLQTRSLVLEFPRSGVRISVIYALLIPLLLRSCPGSLCGQEGLNWALPSMHQIAGFSLAGLICSAHHLAWSLAHVVLSEYLWTERINGL